MKKSDGTFNDGEMICAFNREGFLELDEIYSKGSESGSFYGKEDEFIAYKMILTKYSTVFRGDDNQWKALWTFPYIWMSTENILDNDLFSYLNYIEDSGNLYINEFIRKFMENIDLRYPGFSTYMKDYLGI